MVESLIMLEERESRIYWAWAGLVLTGAKLTGVTKKMHGRSNEPRRGEIFVVHRPKKWTELRRSVMTPRWGLERQEGRRLSTKMPPLRGSIRFRRHRPAFQEITHKFVAHPASQNALTTPAHFKI